MAKKVKVRVKPVATITEKTTEEVNKGSDLKFRANVNDPFRVSETTAAQIITNYQLDEINWLIQKRYSIPTLIISIKNSAVLTGGNKTVYLEVMEDPRVIQTYVRFTDSPVTPRLITGKELCTIIQGFVMVSSALIHAESDTVAKLFIRMMYYSLGKAFYLSDIKRRNCSLIYKPVYNIKVPVSRWHDMVNEINKYADILGDYGNSRYALEYQEVMDESEVITDGLIPYEVMLDLINHVFDFRIPKFTSTITHEEQKCTGKIIRFQKVARSDEDPNVDIRETKLPDSDITEIKAFRAVASLIKSNSIKKYSCLFLINLGIMISYCDTITISPL